MCDHSAQAMYPRDPGASLQKWAHTQVAVGARVACYHDEIKLSLPAMWTPTHHLLFTFFHVDLQTKLEAPKPVSLGRAGSKSWLGKRPVVRGVVMNPVDHPHGGGEGRAPIGRKKPATPWGYPALGRRTRKRKKYSNNLILRRRSK